MVSESGRQAIAERFAHVSIRDLIERMNHAEDFGYDDEQIELDRRLQARGLAWRWAPPGEMFTPVVEVFDPTTGLAVAGF